VSSGTARAAVLRHSAALGRIISNELLTPPGVPAKRHVVIELPEDATYQAGDYLAMYVPCSSLICMLSDHKRSLAENPKADVHRALARFNLASEEEILISASGPTSLPVDKAITAANLLSGYVELSQPATIRDLRALVAATKNADTKTALESLQASYATEVLAKRLSLLDILEAHKDIELPFANFLFLLPAMRIRQYSISSSSLADPRKASVTMSVIEGPALSSSDRKFYGVASTFLAGLSEGDRVQLSIRPASNSFRLPADPSAPVVMFCAGSGIAPMRGFIEERAIQKASGREVGKMMLFYGCRHPEQDYLFARADFAKWIDAGVVDVRPAFSRASEQSLGCKYVQE
jgi:cytochrome P450 / NADPH-cytochrome P450 reductase